jgi:RNA polymerase sigma factor (sigma-70 family)
MPIALPESSARSSSHRNENFLASEARKMTVPLLPRVAEGDREAIQECVDRYGGLIWSLANRLIRNREDVEDAVHDVFIELWQAAARFDASKGSELTFVAMLTRRRLVDRWRAYLRREVNSVDIGEIDVAAPLVRDSSELNDEAQKAAHCFEKLTRQTQVVLRRSIHDNLSYTKIAEELTIPLGSVKSYARRGLMQLRDCMGRNSNALRLEEVQ